MSDKSKKVAAKLQKQKSKLIKTYIDAAKELKRIPSQKDLSVKFGDARYAILQAFGTLNNLHSFIKDNHPEAISHIVDARLFTPKRFQELKTGIKDTKTFIITTAVADKEVHKGFYEAIKLYNSVNSSELLVLPCADIARRSTEVDWNLDGVLKDDYIVFNDLKLNSKIFLSSLQMSAKQIKPLTGLSRIGQRYGSSIYASPKQDLEYYSSTNKKKMPHAIMTTGAITTANYLTEAYMSKRVSYLAETDHVLGAIIVELKNDTLFQFRQVQADPRTGSFIDLGVQYNADGSLEEISPTVVPGDTHVGETEPRVKACIKDLCLYLGVENLFEHDLFDGKSISHHEFDKPLMMAKKTLAKKHVLKDEIILVAKELAERSQWVSGNIYVVKSNHDEVLIRYLVDGKYVRDPQNHRYSLILAAAAIDGKDPLKFAVEMEAKRLNLDLSKVVWLTREDSIKIAGIEMAAHGDKGANGSRAPGLAGLEKAYGSCVVGHSHSAGILRSVFRVGTSSKLFLGYNEGPSSWTHTMCLVYPNGSRQLINVIDGDWRVSQ